MDIVTSTDFAQNSKAHRGRQFVTPQDAESVLVVVGSSWICAAVTLVLFGKLNLILLLAVVGFITGVVVLSSGLSLLTVIALQKLSVRFKQG
ncbi:hypothetical protein [Microvirga aerophila]|uniref:Uncharacterized protein n=1 Tax=Microvirga aerophila TaxID=670291 RepID=A0A512C1E3_9HYPH|nr:hypothetical protein [Microvirga aerophila]GEO18032.1 hypothetical protein MAE02_57280 [Microvirga aerophila]